MDSRVDEIEETCEVLVARDPQLQSRRGDPQPEQRPGFFKRSHRVSLASRAIRWRLISGTVAEMPPKDSTDGSDGWGALDATAQAELVRSGDVAPDALVVAAIERAQQLNALLNAIIHERYERAHAESLDATREDAPFRGVPLVVKDLTLMMEGEPYHCGARFLKAMDYRAPVTSYMYEKFRAAGFVVIGRTNTPEFGTTITTEPMAYGPTRNPWNTDHSTGGSSGGSACAVAAGIVPVGHANDGGGSIRIPASECGLVGLKPTRGRVSQGPAIGESWMGSTIDGVVTRSVRDSARVLDILAGPMPGDPSFAAPPSRAYADEVGVDPGRLRIGYFAGPTLPGFDVHPECVTAVDNMTELLSTFGHVVEDASPAALVDEEFNEHFVMLVAADMAAGIDHWESVIGRPIDGDDIEPGNVALLRLGRSISASQYLGATQWMHAYQRRMASWWASSDANTPAFDLLVTPTIAQPPPMIGWLGDPAGHPTRRIRMLLQYTAQFNITGQPAISLPIHVTSDGLPVGAQLVGAYGREDLLIRAASQVEAAGLWAARRPAVHA